jgi:hypothetical protein
MRRVAILGGTEIKLHKKIQLIVEGWKIKITVEGDKLEADNGHLGWHGNKLHKKISIIVGRW